MGTSTKPVTFIDVNVKLDVHSATNPEHLGEITVEQFANGSPISVETILETGELLITKKGGDFIQGPIVY